MDRDTAAYVETLRELAVRIAAPAFGPRSPKEAPQILVAELPPGFPADIPLPESGVLVGSYVDPRRQVTVYLDIPLPRDAVFAYYHDRLTADGWMQIQDEPRPGGLPSHPRRPPHSTDGGTYCRSTIGPALSLQGVDVSEHTTELRLTMHNEPHICARPGNPPGSEPTIPILLPPPDAEWRPRSSGGGQDAASLWGHLVTDRDARTLLAHYGAQLEAKGWTPAAGEEQGGYTWASWTYSDSDRADRRGVVFISLLHHVGPYARFPFGRGLSERPEMMSQYTIEIHAAWRADTREQIAGNGP
jgi:hypothetical protein